MTITILLKNLWTRSESSWLKPCISRIIESSESSIEKTKVSLTSRVFSKSTSNAMRCYVENGCSHWLFSISLLNGGIFWMSKAPQKGNENEIQIARRIRLKNYDQMSEFFTKIVSWIDAWKSSGKPGLSDETFKTFKQTIPLFAEYLLLEVALEYVLTGKIQSDFLEKIFGRFIQLNDPVISTLPSSVC